MDLSKAIGLGVAGNFAGHLEQAGEAADFVDVPVTEAEQPKAIFPFYVPSSDAGFLSIFPLSSNRIHAPQGEGGHLQIEPEIALICRIRYQGTQVVALDPLYFGAYNDCSIRRPNAKKISEKKNWGANSKGLSDELIELRNLKSGGTLDQYRIACWLQRDGTLHPYGIDSPATGYSYFHEKLLNWIIDKMNNQQDTGPAEDISAHLKRASYPDTAIISIGATRYTEFGESHFLQKGDKSIVLVYNAEQFTTEQLTTLIEQDDLIQSGLSALVQTVE